MTKSARSSRSRSAAAKTKMKALDVDPRSPSLDGRVAIVTGSSKGLGKAMAIALGEAGARVVINYYNGKEQAEQTRDELQGRGIEAIVCRADVTSERQVDKLVGDVEKKLGKPDILVLNATPDQRLDPGLFGRGLDAGFGDGPELDCAVGHERDPRLAGVGRGGLVAARPQQAGGEREQTDEGGSTEHGWDRDGLRGGDGGGCLRISRRSCRR
jgi:hypothetical protein